MANVPENDNPLSLKIAEIPVWITENGRDITVHNGRWSGVVEIYSRN